VRAVGGYAKADASSVEPQYHRHADAHTGAIRWAFTPGPKDCGIRGLDHTRPPDSVSKWAMLKRRILSTVLVSLAGVSVLISAATPDMPVSETSPGMVGIGRTVFDGVHVEEFKAHIIGVLENVIGTRRNLILAKLEGGPLANTGVIAGMSGSPVFVDGRLIGAVSYALGSFSKEPIAGITPIGEMTDSTRFSDAGPIGSKVKVEYRVTRDGLTAAFRKALNWNRPFAERPGDAELSGASPVAGIASGQVGTLLRPIATPLVMSGFE